MKSSARAGLAGVSSAAVALGAAELVAVLTGPLSAPLLAVGGVVVDNVPGPVKDFGVQVFGVHDKTALIVGTAVLLAAYAYVLGVAGIVLFAAIGIAAAVTRHDAGFFAWLPTVTGAAPAVWVLGKLLDLARVRAAAPAAAGTAGRSRARDENDRRRFRKGLGLATGLAVVGGAAGRLLTARQAVAEARNNVALPPPRQAAAPVPAAVQVQSS